MSKIVRQDNGDVDRERTWTFEERRLRRREVYAQELIAAAYFLEPEGAEVNAIRQSVAFKRLYERLSGGPGQA